MYLLIVLISVDIPSRNSGIASTLVEFIPLWGEGGVKVVFCAERSERGVLTKVESKSALVARTLLSQGSLASLAHLLGVALQLGDEVRLGLPRNVQVRQAFPTD